MSIKDIEDEDKDDLQQTFEDFYKKSFMMAKKNKGLKGIMEAMTKENKELKGKVASLEEDLEKLTSINKRRVQQEEDLEKLTSIRRCSSYLVDPKSSPTYYSTKEASFASLDSVMIIMKESSASHLHSSKTPPQPKMVRLIRRRF